MIAKTKILRLSDVKLSEVVHLQLYRPTFERPILPQPQIFSHIRAKAHWIDLFSFLQFPIVLNWNK